MRIVSGRHRGRRLAAPEGPAVRPTADRVREALFDILVHGDLAPRPLEGAVVADLFAGTGALGLEALSRGAARVLAVETDERAIACLRDNARRLGEYERLTVIRADATRLPAAPERCEYALLDAPYGSGLARPALASLARRGWLAPGALAIVERDVREAFEPPAGFSLVDRRRYGATALDFLRWNGEEGLPPRHGQSP